MLRMSSKTQARTLAEQIADTIAYDIVTGQYKAGEKLSETELAEALSVSRGPIRDALVLLERNMLVTIKPRSFTMVNTLTVTELEHVFTFRQHVLGIASQYAAQNRTDADMERLRDGLERLQASIKEKASEYHTLAFPASQLWDLIIDASHSHVVRQGTLSFTGSNIWSNAVQRRIDGSQTQKFERQRSKMWSDLIKQIENQDEAKAFEAGSKLVRSNWLFLKKVFVELFPAT
ncbi:MAG: GntR family transcriptional regulator [Pseudomonadales bacterium]|nr:GntR family transcriptional regulator [Pseudomonadales bacterium]